MGNTAGGCRRPGSVVAPEAAAAPRRPPATAPKRRNDGEGGVAALPGQHHRAGGGVGGVEAAAPAVKVRIVMKRKDVEALVARVNAQKARDRKARMAELMGELRAGDGAGASPPPCRNAGWKPRLTPIQES